MKFSVITPSFNSGAFISGCIDSVNHQTYTNIEQLIIDGGSNDCTLTVINSYKKSRIVKILSEPDQGIYFAMNKGICLASGDIIGILNSDDLYLDDMVISDVVGKMESSGADSLFADLYYVSASDTDKLQRLWKTHAFVPGSFSRGWHPPHPTFFVRKEVYEKYGLFDTSLQVSADFELMLRFLERYRISTCYLPRPILKMRHGGHSSGSLKNIVKGNINCYRAFKKNGIPVSPLYFFYRTWPKVVQYWKRGRE